MGICEGWGFIMNNVLIGGLIGAIAIAPYEYGLGRVRLPSHRIKVKNA